MAVGGLYDDTPRLRPLGTDLGPGTLRYSRDQGPGGDLVTLLVSSGRPGSLTSTGRLPTTEGRVIPV